MERRVVQTLYHTANGNWIDGSLYYEQKSTKRRNAKFKPSSEAQKRLNEDNAKRMATRILHENFVAGVDFIVHPTYRFSDVPITNDRQRKDMRNFLLRVKRLYTRLGIKGEFKYFGTAVGGEKTRRHLHLVITGSKYPNLADEIRALWPFGYCNVDRVQFDGDDGLSGIASYICENYKSAKESCENAFAKHWCASKNLVRPEAVGSRGRIPVSLLPKLAAAEPYARAEILENMFPGYEAVEIDVAELSDMPEDRKYRIFGNYYIYIKLRKISTNHTTSRR